jgi:hypothetical protein
LPDAIYKLWINGYDSRSSLKILGLHYGIAIILRRSQRIDIGYLQIILAEK